MVQVSLLKLYGYSDTFYGWVVAIGISLFIDNIRFVGGNNKHRQFAMTPVPSRDYKLILEHEFSTHHMIGSLYGIYYIFY